MDQRPPGTATTDRDHQQLAIIEGESRIVAPIVDPEKALAAFNAYQALTTAMLKPSDYQTYQQNGKTMRFKKKSAWRKYAVYYSLSIETIDQRIGHRHDKVTCARLIIPDEKECGCPTVYARIVVRCIAPNGRYTEGVGISSLGEKNRSFTKPDHEIPATAYTRAENRAISDMIGAGEDSAEEVRGTAAVPAVAPLEVQAAVARAWKAATELRKTDAIEWMASVGYTPEGRPDERSHKALLGQIISRGTEEHLDALVAILGEPEPAEAGFDPDTLKDEPED